MSRQGARDKLQQIIAPILSMHDPQSLAIQAFGNIRPRISLRFEELGLSLKDGRTVLSGVTGYFGHSKVGLCGISSCQAILALQTEHVQFVCNHCEP